MADKKLMIPAERIENIILLIRGQKVMLDSDLARIYGIQTFRLNEAVKRNKDRFPEDFLFQLTKREYQTLISQNAISKPGRGGRRSLPYAFTEHGAIMAANMLNSPIAIQMSIFVVRAFVKMRETLASNRTLAEKLAELERKLTGRLDTHEKAIVHILKEIKKLTTPPEKPRRRIGFKAKEARAAYRGSRKGQKN
jgi:phage regulator Rha-like protein